MKKGRLSMGGFEFVGLLPDMAAVEQRVCVAVTEGCP
jgi:hypothetical protein